MILDPVIIVGCPRSRTSLAMQLLELSGLFLGKTIGVTKANPQGQKENWEIDNTIIRSELKKHGFDPKAQYPLPPQDWHNINPNLKDSVLKIIKKQGLQENQKWGVKIPKSVFNWQSWDNAFPNADWIIVRRNDEDIVKSCMSPKATFMDAYKTEQGWHQWIEAYKSKFTEIEETCKFVYTLDTDSVINKDLRQLKSIISATGLVWKPDKIRAQICP